MMGPVSQSATAASKYYYEKDPIYEKNNSRWLGGGLRSSRPGGRRCCFEG